MEMWNLPNSTSADKFGVNKLRNKETTEDRGHFVCCGLTQSLSKVGYLLEDRAVR